VGHVGSTTITERLDAPPGTRAFQRAYDAALGRSSLLLDQARGKARQLTPIELAGVAGAWARRAPLPVSGDSIGPEAVAAVLEALTALGVALPLPVPPDWRPAPESLDPGLLQQQLATEQLGWVALAVSVKYGPPGYVLDGQMSHREAAEWLARTVCCLRAGIEHWALEASRQLHAVGVLVDPLQRQLVAARIVRLGLVPKAEQVRAYESGELPSPLPEYPPPPSPLKQTSGPTLQEALDVWAQRRRPVPKTIHDAQGRLRDLIDWLGTDQLEQLSAEKANGWVQELLHSHLRVQSVTRRVALVKAVLSGAREAVDPSALI
jgi:hypothetical protein